MVNWALATTPKDQGGLGIRNIQLANQALLAKWCWQWYDSNRPWWTEATYTAHQSEKPWFNPNQTPFWKQIATVAPAFHCSISHHIEDGNKSQFWQDNWQGTPLKYQFPNLYQQEQQQYLSVNQHATQLDWIALSPMHTLATQTERIDLTALLQPFQITALQDQVTWLRSDKPFTVSSFYKFLSHSPSPNTSLKNLWAIKAPLRVMIFAWLVLNNRLTTIDNLVRRGWYLTNMCTMCREKEESVPHLFESCKLAVQIRNYLQATYSSQAAISDKFTSTNSIQLLTDSTESRMVKNLEITTCFVLWRERCRRTFSNKSSTHLSLVREIRAELQNWFTSSSTQITNNSEAT